MGTRSRSRSRERPEVRIKSERVSPSLNRLVGLPTDQNSVRLKREDIHTKPIYLDSTGRPIRRELGAGLSHSVDSPSANTTAPPLEVEKPNFEPSGLLAAETNQRNGVALKYTVPPESRLPVISWRLYVLKPDEADRTKMNVLKTIHLDAQEYYLFGCDRRVADVEIFHPTISKQHAVIQHRLVDNNLIVPYVIDLESTNGTFLNSERIKPSCYYELRERDIIKFGMSTREYVVLNDRSI
ncbi:FHA domain containing protein [Babesia divergens]|uniref:FHA domain containing protein n=1 Tax=Babesia divergens TaxID=32595 RepID=A0AAD9GFH3_BABDI|nr:FHA domain containing protein [Babesia divergens]